MKFTRPARVLLQPANLRRNTLISAFVGTTLLAVNHLLLTGHTPLVEAIRTLMPYLVPFLVSNYLLLLAARQTPRVNT